MPRVRCSFLILMCSGITTVRTVSGQTAPEKPRFEMRVSPRKPVPPQPRAGDAIRIGPDGEVVLEWKNASGDIVQRRIPRRNRVVPEIETEIEFAGAGLVHYSYMVGNGIAAHQNIVFFALGVTRPDLIRNSSPPVNWHSYGPVPGVSRRDWSSDERGYDIMPGQSKGPFRYEAPALPGLMEAHFQGYLSTEERAVDPDGWRLSTWLMNQMSEALSFENSSVRVYIVGPKFEITPELKRSQLADAIADDMLAASRMPEFAVDRFFLENASSTLKSTPSAAPRLRGQMLQMGGTTLKKSFFRAMALNLEYMAKLP